jgi:hypothetical protein
MYECVIISVQCKRGANLILKRNQPDLAVGFGRKLSEYVGNHLIAVHISNYNFLHVYVTHFHVGARRALSQCVHM